MSIEMYANVYVTYHMRSVARMVPVTLPGHACSAAGTAVADSLSPSRSTSPATRPVTMAMGCLEGSPQEGSSHPPGWVLGDLVTCLWVQRCSTVKDRKSCCSFWIRFEPLELIRTRWGSVAEDATQDLLRKDASCGLHRPTSPLGSSAFPHLSTSNQDTLWAKQWNLLGSRVNS